mmetsp:Transcript_17804/g.41311  ORF Transcript_17804/g.41311 Transcript_17804/m.41311 type:complete len:361 (-) Transcript_17804:75-1157(-)
MVQAAGGLTSFSTAGSRSSPSLRLPSAAFPSRLPPSTPAAPRIYMFCPATTAEDGWRHAWGKGSGGKRSWQEDTLPSHSFYATRLVAGVTGQARQLNTQAVSLPDLSASFARPGAFGGTKSRKFSSAGGKQPRSLTRGRNKRPAGFDSEDDEEYGHCPEEFYEDLEDINACIGDIRSAMNSFEPGRARPVGDRSVADESSAKVLGSVLRRSVKDASDDAATRQERLQKYRYVRKIDPPTPPFSTDPLCDEDEAVMAALARVPARDIVERNRSQHYIKQFSPMHRKQHQERLAKDLQQRLEAVQRRRESVEEQEFQRLSEKKARYLEKMWQVDRNKAITDINAAPKEPGPTEDAGSTGAGH